MGNKKKRPYRLASLLAVGAIVLLAVGADAQPPSEHRPIPVSEFTPFAFAPARTDPPATDTPSPPPAVPDAVIVDPVPVAPLPVPDPAPRHQAQPKPRAQPRDPSSSGTSQNGIATWYCKTGVSVCHYKYPDGPGTDLYAAAGSELRVGHWRGRVVTVCERHTRNCVTVRLIDWCACGGARIIDLYWDAARVIGDTGVMGVTVSW